MGRHETATTTETMVKAKRAWAAGESHLMITGMAVKFTAVSGAAVTVASHEELAMHERKPGKTRTPGLSYRAAGGGCISRTKEIARW